MEADSTKDTPTQTAADVTEGMGKTVGRGGFLLAASSIGARGLSFLVQIVLGYLLAKEDFGVFAIALSVATFAQLLRDGGVQQVLIQRGEKDYDELRGPAFWLAMTFNLIAGVAIVAATPIIVRLYGEKVSHLTWIIAAWIPFSTPACLYRTRFLMLIQMDRVAQMQIGVAFIRAASVLSLALLGFGAYSFVIPYLITTVFETAFGYHYTREIPWAHGFGVRLWRTLFSTTRWLMLSTLASGLNLQGAYLVLGYFLSSDLVGVFFFGYQLATQFTILVAWNFFSALFPVLSRLTGQPERRHAALMRSIRAVMFVCAPVSLALVAVIAPLEALIWGGKWAASVPCVIALGVLIPFRGALFVSFADLQAQGRFRLYGLIELTHALGLMSVAGAASYFWGTAESVSWAVGLFLGAAGLGLTVALSRRGGGRLSDILASIGGSWLVSVVIAAICLAVDRFLLQDSSSLVRVGVESAIFAALSWITMRTLLKRDAMDLVRAVPRRIGRLLAIALRLEFEPISPAPVAQQIAGAESPR